jgi:hypothetical protein
MLYTLEDVVKEFESWRQERISKKERIPSQLWHKTKSLLPHYKRSHIQRALKISGQQFNEQCLSHKQGNDVLQTDGFVAGVIEPAINKDEHCQCELTLKGLRKSLLLKVNIQQLPKILPLLEGYL